MKSEGREFLDLLEEVAAVEDLPDLLAACSGRRLYVPHRPPREESWIVAAIGQEKADALVRRLDEAGWRGSEIDIPYDGGGIVRAFREATKSRIAEGVKAGKSNRVIAAEIGITRRAVVMSKARMRKRGELPETDPVMALRTRYLGPAVSSTPAPPEMNARFWDSPPQKIDGTVVTTGEGAISVELRDPLPGNASTRDRIIALMKRECGEIATSRILELAGSRSLSIRPSAARSPKHLFNVVLGDGQGSTLALKIVAAIPGTELIRLKDVPTKLTPMAARIREKLLDGIVPERIASDLNVPIRKVHAQAQTLRRAGLLPPARPRRKSRGY